VVRLVGMANRVETLDQRAGEVGMPAVDLGVDHRHQHVAAGRHAMHLPEVELVDDVLVEFATLAAGRELWVLLQLEDIIRLCEAAPCGSGLAAAVRAPPGASGVGRFGAAAERRGTAGAALTRLGTTL